jgi:hypothetical protein
MAEAGDVEGPVYLHAKTGAVFARGYGQGVAVGEGVGRDARFAAGLGGLRFRGRASAKHPGPRDVMVQETATSTLAGSSSIEMSTIAAVAMPAAMVAEGSMG